MKLDVWLKKITSCIVLKTPLRKTFVANEQFCVYIQCRRRPTDRLHLKFPFSRRKWRSRSSPFPVNGRRSRELSRSS